MRLLSLIVLKSVVTALFVSTDMRSLSLRARNSNHHRLFYYEKSNSGNAFRTPSLLRGLEVEYEDADYTYDKQELNSEGEDDIFDDFGAGGTKEEEREEGNDIATEIPSSNVPDKNFAGLDREDFPPNTGSSVSSSMESGVDESESEEPPITSIETPFDQSENVNEEAMPPEEFVDCGKGEEEKTSINDIPENEDEAVDEIEEEINPIDIPENDGKIQQEAPSDVPEFDDETETKAEEEEIPIEVPMNEENEIESEKEDEQVPTGFPIGEENETENKTEEEQIPNDVMENDMAPVAAQVSAPVVSPIVLPPPVAVSTSSSYDSPVAAPTYDYFDQENDIEEKSAPTYYPTIGNLDQYSTPEYMKPPTNRPTVPYISSDDDPLKNDELDKGIEGGMNSLVDWFSNESTINEMEHDKNVIIALSVVFGAMFIFSIFTAYQLLENPEGCCASICRITVACWRGIVLCVCYPCRAICGCTNKQRSGRHTMVGTADEDGFTHDLELS